MDELMADGRSPLKLQPLSLDGLSDLPNGVGRPNYQRADLSAGIVHIGLGNFHRAHQAWYLHRLMQQGKALDWAIIGAGVRPADAAQRERLMSQDCLTTLIELDPAGKSAEIIGPMIDFLPVEPDNKALIRQMSDPAIRIVSLTVTEGGYFLEPSTGGFDTSHPDIQHDAAHPDAPRTAFGAMVAALRMRRDNGDGPFTGQSCDNLQGNGDILRQAVVSLARMSDPALADWIEKHCSFPNAMVDCIVPATGSSEIALAEAMGIEDTAPVTHENFRQWVIEDKFCAGRPPWEDVGVTITEDVHAFEAMKLRILNAGHQIIADPAELLSINTIAAAMADPLIRAFLHKVVSEEIAPHIAAVPGMTAGAYLSQVDRRFSNPEIKDTTRRVAYDGSSRHPGFLIPSIRDGLTAGTSVQGLALATALWARYCQGTREDGSVVEPNDPNWAELQRTALRAQVDPAAWLGMTKIYGDLMAQPIFADAFSSWLGLVNDRGVRAALRTYLGN